MKDSVFSASKPFHLENQSLSLSSIVYLPIPTNFLYCSRPKFDFEDVGLRSQIRHAKTKHPDAWMKLRTGQTIINPIQKGIKLRSSKSQKPGHSPIIE